MLNSFLNKRFLLFVSILFFSLQTFTQEKTNSTSISIDELVDFSETIYGNDDRLVCGQIYQQQHFRAKGHPYFYNDEWQNGRVFIKGNVFNNCQLKYNIESNQLILKAKLKNNNIRHILLNNEIIDSLYINNRLFINSSLLPILEANRFYEKLHQGSFTAYLKHTIEYQKETSQSSLFGKYKKAYYTLYFHNTNGFEEIPNLKYFLNYFDEDQKEIKKFIRENHIRFQKLNNFQLSNLLKYCDEISSK